MSSLAAARADNFYHGPDYDPAKHGSLNKYRGSHGALGARANKLDQGILVIRFEVPFHLWCAKCGEKVAKGERFNAEKKQIGNYHSTKIWEFRMTHHCGSLIIITTDPKNAQYCVVEGARQKVESYTAEDAEVLELQDQEERDRLRNDPLYRLEHGERVKKEARTAAQQLSDLQELNHDLHADPYALNKRLRAQLRAAKKESAALDARRDALNLPESLELLPEEEGDKVEAQIAFLSAEDRGRHPSHWRSAILSQSIFSSSAKKYKSSSRWSSQPVAPSLPTAAAAAAAAASAGRGSGLGSGPSGPGLGFGLGVGIKAMPTPLPSAPLTTGRSGQVTAAGQRQHEHEQQQQQQQQQQQALHQQRHHSQMLHAPQTEAEAGRTGQGGEGAGVSEPLGAGLQAAAPASAHKNFSSVSKQTPSSSTSAAYPKGRGAGALAAAPSSATASKGPGAGALAAAAARGLKWKPKAGAAGSGHPNSHLGGGKANGHKGVEQWGLSGHPGGQAGAGAKRSLMGKAELLAKRQKLEGLKLGLGGMK